MADEHQIESEAAEQPVSATDDSSETQIDAHYKILADLESIRNAASKAFEDIEAARSTATKAASSAEEMERNATTSIQTVSQALADIQARSGEIQAALPQAKESLQSSRQVVETISGLHSKAQTQSTQIENFVPTVEEATENVTQYERDLSELKLRIESLLPGATSAGLAKAFQVQKERFVWPKRLWAVAFVSSIFGLIAIAAYGATGLIGGELSSSWENILTFLGRRLPIAAPLVWLAYFAGRRYMDAIRIEEDYAFKEAISSAFEGYKAQMSDLGGESSESSPLMTLCNNQLRSLAVAPGRIYTDGHARDITLATPVGELLQSLGDASRKINDIKPTTPWSDALPQLLEALGSLGKK